MSTSVKELKNLKLIDLNFRFETLTLNIFNSIFKRNLDQLIRRIR